MAEGGSNKPTVVRIKRKRCDEPVDLFWLEQNAAKRQDIGNLSLDDQPSSSSNGRTLFRRLQTVPVSQAKDVSLSESLMSDLLGKTDKQEVRRNAFKRLSKPEVTVKQQHEKESKTARYKQVWRNRMLGKDAMQEFFQLYDVVRTDDEEKRRDEEEEEKRKDSELLMKYMPLLREHCPEQFGAAAESATSSADDFVYDVYGQDDIEIGSGEDEEDLLTLQVSDTLEADRDEDAGSDFDSQDSNREDHPDYDYPDEEDEDNSSDEASSENDEEDEDDDDKITWRSMRR